MLCVAMSPYSAAHGDVISVILFYVFSSSSGALFYVWNEQALNRDLSSALVLDVVDSSEVLRISTDHDA